MERLQASLKAQAIEVAHLKTVLAEPDGGLASMQLTRTAEVPRFTRRLEKGLVGGQAELTVNLRAEGAPEMLEAYVSDTLGAEVQVSHVEAFRPGQPTPTHRANTLSAV